jgi:hypothetical protein
MVARFSTASSALEGASSLNAMFHEWWNTHAMKNRETSAQDPAATESRLRFRR